MFAVQQSALGNREHFALVVAAAGPALQFKCYMNGSGWGIQRDVYMLCSWQGCVLMSTITHEQCWQHGEHICMHYW
jgi:hypothetical protein